MFDEESRLIEGAKNHDENAWYDLRIRHHGRLLGVVLRSIGNKDDADDVAQETWTGAVAGIHGFERGSSFFTWLCKIASYKIADFFRKNARSPQFAFLGENIAKLATDRDNPSERPPNLEEIGVTVTNRIPDISIRALTRQYLEDANNDYSSEPSNVLEKMARTELEAEGICEGKGCASFEFNKFLEDKIEAIKERIRNARKSSGAREARDMLRTRRGFLIAIGTSSASLTLGESFAFGGGAMKAVLPALISAEALTGTNTPHQLIELLKSLPHTHSIRNSLGGAFRTLRKPDRQRLLSLLLSSIPNACEADSNVGGLLANTVVSFVKELALDPRALRRLESFCKTALARPRIGSIKWVESLAYALSTFGRDATFVDYLSRITLDDDWRRFAVQWYGDYYNTRSIPIQAIRRHLGDSNRTGVRTIHDLPIIVEAISKPKLLQPNVQSQVQYLLPKYLRVLQDLGMHDLRAFANEIATRSAR